MLCVGYLAILLTGLLGAMHVLLHTPPPVLTPLLRAMVSRNAVLLLWRLGVRATFAGRNYGWRQGLLAVPRALISNIIAMIAARRAVVQYLRMRRTGVMVWDKTQHAFPSELLAE